MNTMKIFIFVAMVALAAARPDKDATIVAEESEANPDAGTYKWSFKTSNGIERSEEGAQKQITPEEAGQTSKGEWSYTAPDGSKVALSFTADENGYQPSGDSLPTPPPMPAHVVKLLQSIARRKAAA